MISFIDKPAGKKKPMKKYLFPKEDKRKVKKLVESKSFDFFIMSIILADALVLGLLSSGWKVSLYYEQGLFLLDRLFMAIFIVEMLMKIYAEGKSFFKNGWNVFDFVIIAVSSVPLTSAFIILRTFRLFRLFKYIHHFSKLNDIISVFIAMLPVFASFIAVFVVFLYVFAIIAVNLYGDIFGEFSTLGRAMAVSLNTFAMDGWSSGIARKVTQIFPNAWMFFMTQTLIAFMLVVSFLVSAFSQAVKIVKNQNP